MAVGFVGFVGVEEMGGRKNGVVISMGFIEMGFHSGVISQSIYRGYNFIALITGFFGAHPTRRKVGKQKGVELGVMSAQSNSDEPTSLLMP